MHVKNVHQKSGKIACSECNKSMKKENMGRHMKNIHSGKQDQFQCKLCTFKTIYSESLRGHIKYKHQGVRYDCNICEYKATTKGSLADHIKSMHLNERQQQCNICDYKTTTKSKLTKHVKNVHCKSEQIMCTQCNKLIQKRYLNQHMKMLHSEVKPPQYDCTICSFQTIYQTGVKLHVKKVHQKGRKQ